MRRALGVAALLGSLALVTASCGDEPSSAGIAHVETGTAHERATEEQMTAGAGVVSNVGAELYGPIADDATVPAAR